MTRFERIFRELLKADYKKNPMRYVRSLEREIEVNINDLITGNINKDAPIIDATCTTCGLPNNYQSIKWAMRNDAC
jgi:hypothetical protein